MRERKLDFSKDNLKASDLTDLSANKTAVSMPKKIPKVKHRPLGTQLCGKVVEAAHFNH